jgi:hypothetical protein
VDKIQNATKFIAKSWDPEAIKVQVYEMWTNTFEPHIPVSVRQTTWDDAFESWEEEVILHHNATLTNTTMNGENLTNDLHIEVDAAIAFFHFAMDTATSSSMYNMAITMLMIQVMKYHPEFLSHVWHQFINSDMLIQHLFVLMVVLGSGIWIWHNYQQSQNWQAEHQ